VVISFNNPDWDEIRRLGLEWLFIDETPDERLLSAIVQRIVDMPVGQTLPIKDRGEDSVYIGGEPVGVVLQIIGNRHDGNDDHEGPRGENQTRVHG
jgi:hypothetical protein